MINLHLTEITKLFDLENLELYGTYAGDGGGWGNCPYEVGYGGYVRIYPGLPTPGT